jgi:hypothetical protein
MNKQTVQELWWLSPDGEMHDPVTGRTTAVDDLGPHKRIVLVVPAKEGDAKDFGYLAIVECDL